MFLLISLLIFFYLFFRLILTLPWKMPFRLLAGAALFVLTQHFNLLRMFFGWSSMELPPAVMLLSGWVFASTLLLFGLTLVTDLLLLAGKIWCRFLPPHAAGAGRAVFSPGRRQALLAGLALLPAAYGLRQGTAGPAVRRTEAVLPGLPRGLDGLTLVQISDLHASALLSEEYVRQVVEQANALNPDFILLTGDMVDGSPAARAADVGPLRRLRARHGVFACAGNHEYYSNFTAWMKKFRELGLPMLLNSHAALNIKGTDLVIAGVTDAAAARFNLPPPDLAAALRGAPEGATRILLRHRPSNLGESVRAGVSLQLSGHTHGGQIIGLRPLVARFNQGYTYGWYERIGLKLYVTSGAGLWSGFPVRLGVPSEIAAITLRRG
ncbi:MAG: metallophosphoesterase [Deltaproteobacteria bacterium]|jgi:predicted MPP superfamily phosphohydrolase|nr:metallophosphoesterase [Deltaproteobacteria bacterium]